MKEEVVAAGFGGQGILLLGEIIARAAMLDGRETVCVPAYGPEVRGGFAHSSVIISDRRIGAITISEPDTLIIMNQTGLEKFLPRLRQGGCLLLNTSLVRAPELDGSTLIPVEATEMAEELGNIRVANSIMLGAYVAAKGILTAEACLKALDSGLRGRAKALAEINKLAFQKGLAVSLPGHPSSP